MNKYLPFILIIVAVGLFFVFIDPQYSEVQELLEEKQENETLLDLAQDLQDKRDELRNSFNNISTSEKEQLQKLLPDTVDNVRLILDINNIAEDYGVIIRNIDVQSEDQSSEVLDTQQVVSSGGDNIGTITLSFSMVATYDVFIQLMKDLEQALRIVDIRTLDVQRVSPESNFLNFNITLDTYWLR